MRIIVFVALLFSLSFPAVQALAASDKDSEYDAFKGEASLLLPKYWNAYEVERKTIDNDPTDEVYMQSQSELSSRLTKYVYFEKSNRSGVFALPPSATDKLSESDLVNFYVYSNLKNSIDGHLISASKTSMNGQDGYNVKWTYLSPGGLVFGVNDYFFFRGSNAYQLQGEYVINLGTDIKSLIDSVTSSVKFLK